MGIATKLVVVKVSIVHNIDSIGIELGKIVYYFNDD